MNAPLIPPLLLTPAAAVALLLSSLSAGAAIVGADDASSNAYLADDATANDGDPANNTNGWVSGDDGFTSGALAFQPWTLSTGGTGGANVAGFFIGDSRNLSGGSGADINTLGNRSFGMFGTSTAFANAQRLFDSPLALGQSFSLQLAVNFRNGQKGVDVVDSTNAVIFNFNVGNLGVGDDYTVQNAASGNGSIGNSYSANTAFEVLLTQTSAGGGTWRITRSGGVTDVDNGTYAGAPAGVKVYVSGTGGGSASDLFVNKLSTIPEPGSAGLLGAGLLVFASRRCRKIATVR